MTIKTLEYEDRQRHWKLERTEFDAFNLLVGVSGAGKTSVIEALRDVRSMGLGSARPWTRRPPGGERRWCIELEADDGHAYRWEAEVSALEGTTERSWHDQLYDPPRPDATRFVRERITQAIEGQRGDIVERSPEQFLFRGKRLPRLKDTESAISLLKEEPLVAPLNRALERILFTVPEQVFDPDERYVDESEEQRPGSPDELREATTMSVLVKAYLARLDFPDVFETIRTHYMSIFDSVVDLTVDSISALDPAEAQRAPLAAADMLTIAVKERGADEWIPARYISSGMLRTFRHLAELELAPPGTTIVIDEYENSMGVNCLPEVTDLFLRRQDALQFILTSHHPYVIDNVPMDWWRVVTRHGGTLSVRPARDIPELNTRSRQDAFTLLLNSSVYQEGIQ